MYQSTNRNDSSRKASPPKDIRLLEEEQYVILFEDPKIRQAFMRKVFMIVLMQLISSIGILCLFVFVKPLNDFLFEHAYLIFVAAGVLIVLTIVISCFESLRRRSPINFVLLGLYTFTVSFLISFGCARVDAEILFSVLGITTLVVLVLILFALQTRFDFTVCGCGLFIVLILFLICGMVAIFFPSRALTLGLSSIGVLLFSVYLIYDVQLMMGGKHRYAISPEEYIFAALSIYTDIMLIFMYILELFQAS